MLTNKTAILQFVVLGNAERDWSIWPNAKENGCRFLEEHLVRRRNDFWSINWNGNGVLYSDINFGVLFSDYADYNTKIIFVVGRPSHLKISGGQ